MKKIFLLLFVTILSTAIYAQNTETQYYRYQSEINGLCVNYPEGMKPTCDNETTLEIDSDNITFVATFNDASKLSEKYMKDNLEKIIKKTGIDNNSITLLELKNNKTIEGSLYIGANKKENADFYLIHGFVQSKISPQIAFQISIICTDLKAEEAGRILGTLEFYPEKIK